MAEQNEAVRRCLNHGLEPVEAFVNQFLIAETGADVVAGLKPFEINKWTLHHGAGVEFTPMADEKDRLFGVFIGVGVDSDGAVVGPKRFARFNTKSAKFEADFEEFVKYTAGRYAVLLDVGARTRLYFDPLAHLTTFCNPHTRRVASNCFLTINRPVILDPLAGASVDTMREAHRALPLGHTPDQDARIVPGNHMIDLGSFEVARFWPQRNTIRKVAAEKAGPVIEKMAERMRSVIGGLLDGRDCILPVTGGGGSRMILAAAGERRGEFAQHYCFASDAPGEAEDADVAQDVCAAAGVSLATLTDEAAALRFDDSRLPKRQRKRVFWLRTSNAFRATSEVGANTPGLQWKHHVVLHGLGADVLLAGWRDGMDAGRGPLAPGPDAEMMAVFAKPVEEADTGAVAGEYEAWKASLPKTLQDAVHDFIRMEWQQPAAAARFYAYEDNFCVSPFSDRALIELALKLPEDYRFGPALRDALIAAADPALSGLPFAAPPAPADGDALAQAAE